MQIKRQAAPKIDSVPPPPLQVRPESNIFPNFKRNLLCYDVVILIRDTSSVSESTNTISLDSEKDGTAIRRTNCPSVPCMTFVPNSG